MQAVGLLQSGPLAGDNPGQIGVEVKSKQVKVILPEPGPSCVQGDWASARRGPARERANQGRAPRGNTNRPGGGESAGPFLSAAYRTIAFSWQLLGQALAPTALRPSS